MLCLLCVPMHFDLIFPCFSGLVLGELIREASSWRDSMARCVVAWMFLRVFRGLASQGDSYMSCLEQSWSGRQSFLFHLARLGVDWEFGHGRLVLAMENGGYIGRGWI